MLNKYLVIFFFATGDASCPYYDIQVIVCAEPNSPFMDELNDSFTSFLETPAAAGMDYEDIVETVLDASGYTWSYFGSTIPELNGVRYLWL